MWTDQSLELPGAGIDGLVPDRDAWLRRIEPAYDKLVAKIDQVEARKQQEEYARGVRDVALEDFDVVYGEALAYVQALYRMVGVTERVVRDLRPDFERRRLIREARQERKARAEGRRAQVLRSVVSVAAGWLQR